MPHPQNTASELAGDLERLRGLLRRGRLGQPVEAIQALGRLGTPALEPLCGALQDPAIPVRIAAAEALGRLADAGAVQPLTGSLSEEFGPEYQGAAAGAMVLAFHVVPLGLWWA